MKIKFDILSKDIFFFLFILLAFTLPYATLINSVIISFIVLLWLIEGKFVKKYKDITKHKVLIISIVFYFLHIIGLTYTSNFKAGILIVEKLLSFLIFPLIIGGGLLGNKLIVKKHILYFTLILSYLIATICCMSFASFRTLNSGDYKSYNINTMVDEWHFLYTGLSSPLKIHPVYFALHISIILFIIVYHYKYFFKINKLVTAIIFLNFNLFLILLSARTIIFSYFLIFFICFGYIVLSNKRKAIAFLFGLILLSSLIVLVKTPQITHRFKEVLNFDYDISNPTWQGWSGTTIRFAEWKCAWDVIKGNFYFGVGTGDGGDELMKSYKKNNFIRGIDNNWNCHNQYLETWLKIGIIGLLALLILYLASLRIGWISKNYLQVTFIIMFIIASSTESIFATQKGIVFFSFINSIFSYRNSFFVSNSYNYS